MSPAVKKGAAPTFLAECYWPGVSPEQAAAAVGRIAVAASQMARAGHVIRCLQGTFLPVEESLLCLFEAQSPREVAEARPRANVGVDRIVAAVVLVPRTQA